MLNTWNLKDFDWSIETASRECYGVEPPIEFENNY